MKHNKCSYCNEVILGDRVVCQSCERKQMKIGMILQSLNSTKEDVELAYDFMEVKNDT